MTRLKVRATSSFRYINNEECDKIETISRQIQNLSKGLLDIASKEARRSYLDGYLHTDEGKRLHRGYLKIFEGANTCIGAVNDCRMKPLLSKEVREE